MNARTRTVHSKLSTLAVVTAVALGAWLTAPDEAQALDLQIGGSAIAGGASPTVRNSADIDVVEEPEGGFSFGAEGHFLLRFGEFFSLGPNLQYTYADTEGRRGEYSFYLPSAGLMARLNMDMFALGFWVNYGFGSIEQDHYASSGRADAEYDLSGVSLGFQPMLRFQLHPYRTYIELGGYFTYNFLSMDDVAFTSVATGAQDTRDVEWTITQFGVSLGLTFDFGTGGRRGSTVRRQYGSTAGSVYQ